MEKLKLFPLGLICFIVWIGYGNSVLSDEKLSEAIYEVKKIKSEDGTELSATFFDGGAKQIVVCVPGGTASKESYYFLAKHLQRFNIASLSLDGRSESAILSAVDFSKQKDFEKIVFVGGSIGAGTILTTIKYTLTDTQKALIE